MLLRNWQHFLLGALERISRPPTPDFQKPGQNGSSWCWSKNQTQQKVTEAALWWMEWQRDLNANQKWISPLTWNSPAGLRQAGLFQLHPTPTICSMGTIISQRQLLEGWQDHECEALWTQEVLYKCKEVWKQNKDVCTAVVCLILNSTWNWCINLFAPSSMVLQMKRGNWKMCSAQADNLFWMLIMKAQPEMKFSQEVWFLHLKLAGKYFQQDKSFCSEFSNSFLVSLNSLLPFCGADYFCYGTNPAWYSVVWVPSNNSVKNPGSLWKKYFSMLIKEEGPGGFVWLNTWGNICRPRS